MNANVVAIIVTFNPDIERLRKLVGVLASQAAHTVLVDNASTVSIPQAALLTDNASLEIVQLTANFGIAEAQNQGLAIALNLACDAVVFFDQDSQIEAGFMRALWETFDDSSVGIAAPVLVDQQQGFEYPVVNVSSSGLRQKYRPGELDQEVDISVAISSGTMVRRKVFESAGLMDVGLFIDYVDTEWCLRCARLGWFVRVNPRARMIHSIGETVLKLGVLRVPIHKPERRYYRIRNAFLLLRYPHVPTLMCVQEIVVGLVHQVVHMVFTHNKKAHAAFYVKAVWDGIRGVAGPCRLKRK